MRDKSKIVETSVGAVIFTSPLFMASSWIAHTFGSPVSWLVTILGVAVLGLVALGLFLTGVWFDGDVVKVQRMFHSQVLSLSQCVCVQLKVTQRRARSIQYPYLRAWLVLKNGEEVVCPIALEQADAPGATDFTRFMNTGLLTSHVWKIESLRSLVSHIPLSDDPISSRFSDVMNE